MGKTCGEHWWTRVDMRWKHWWIWDAHVVDTIKNGPRILYIDKHLIHDYTILMILQELFILQFLCLTAVINFLLENKS